MRFWSSFVAVLAKEFLHIRRDRGTLVLAVSIPVFQLILFGFIDLTVSDLPTVVVDQSRTQYSRRFAEQAEASGTFEVKWVTTDPRWARERIIAGDARVGVVIPPDFGDKRARGLPVQVLVLIDGSDSTAASQALAAVNGLAATANLEEVAPRLSTQPVLLFNPAGRTANFIMPGLVAILLQIVALVLAAVAIVREKERGTLEQLLVTPIDPLGLALGKVAPYLLVGLGEMAIILFLMRFGFGVPIRGSLLFLFGTATVYLFALLAMGTFISRRAHTQAQAQQMAQLFFLPAVFLSDYIFPAAGLPTPLYLLGQLLPATHMIAILRGVVLRDAGILHLLPNVLALLGLSLFWIWLGVRRFRKQLLWQ